MTETAMHRKIAFAGVGEVALSKTAVRSALDLAVEASQAALADAGLTPRDVDGVLTASPAGDPHFMFSTLLVEALGIPARINTTLQSAGRRPVLHLLYAARAIMSGACHTVLVARATAAAPDSRATRFRPCARPGRGPTTTRIRSALRCLANTL